MSDDFGSDLRKLTEMARQTRDDQQRKATESANTQREKALIDGSIKARQEIAQVKRLMTEQAEQGNDFYICTVNGDKNHLPHLAMAFAEGYAHEIKKQIESPDIIVEVSLAKNTKEKTTVTFKWGSSY